MGGPDRRSCRAPQARRGLAHPSDRRNAVGLAGGREPVAHEVGGWTRRLLHGCPLVHTAFQAGGLRLVLGTCGSASGGLQDLGSSGVQSPQTRLGVWQSIVTMHGDAVASSTIRLERASPPCSDAGVRGRRRGLPSLRRGDADHRVRDRARGGHAHPRAPRAARDRRARGTMGGSGGSSGAVGAGRHGALAAPPAGEVRSPGPGDCRARTYRSAAAVGERCSGRRGRPARPGGSARGDKRGKNPVGGVRDGGRLAGARKEIPIRTCHGTKSEGDARP